MKRLAIPSFLALVALSFFAVTAGSSGCGDPLVGLTCRDGYSACGRACYDLQNDEQHCGSCDTRCSAGEMCVAGMCEIAGDGSVDAGDDAGLDGSLDGGDLDGEVGDGAADGAAEGGEGEGGAGDGGFADVQLPPLCTGPGSPADCVCDLGELACELNCVNASIDLENCGACGNNCNATPPPSGQYFCINGTCVLNCDPPLFVCGNACVDRQTDPNNCGACGNLCASGLCDLGQCLDATAGHVIVIGHDMSNALPAAKRLAGNAIFLPAKQTVKGLVYAERSTQTAKNGVDLTIADMSAITGRTFKRTNATSALSVPFLLSQADVFVIVAQANASDDVLLKNGDTWSRSLNTFVRRGGVIVLFDASGKNAGTYQLLQQAGLFTAAERVKLSPRTVTIEAPGDALASFVPTRYQAQNETVGFDTMEQTVVVRDTQSDLPVVIHIAR